MRVALAALALAACGRVGFALPAGDATTPLTDTPTIDAPAMLAGPALWLKMDTDPGTGIIDSGGAHSISCLDGSCPKLRTGQHAAGFRFTSEDLVVVFAADLDPSHGFTAAMWVQLATLPVGDPTCPFHLPFNDANAWDTFTLCIDAAGTTQFDGETPSGTADLETGPKIGVGAWHHLALSWDGTTKRGYLDGAEVASKAIVLGVGTQNPTVGGSRGGFHLNGTLDDVMYYTRALAAAEVAQLATP